MPDQIIDAIMASAIQVDAARAHPLLAWIVMHDPPEYPDAFVARLVTSGPTPYLLRAECLAEVHAQLPRGLVRAERQPVDPPEVVEVWFLR